MSLRLLNLLHTQRLVLREEAAADALPTLDGEDWIAEHADLLDAYADLGVDLLTEDIDGDDLRLAVRQLVDLVFTAGYRAAGTDAAATPPAHLSGPLPQEPEEEDSDVSDPVPAL